MDSKLTHLSQQFHGFKAAMATKDYKTCTELLSQLKVLLSEFKSLPPLFEETPNLIHELTIARDIYEQAVLLHVKVGDQDAFERDFSQLKPYYYRIVTRLHLRLPPSSNEYMIVGLNLLKLLVQNKIAEFHTELKIVSYTALENPCIKLAVELEQFFMEGVYDHVLSAKQNLPDECYGYFMDLLANTAKLC